MWKGTLLYCVPIAQEQLPIGLLQTSLWSGFPGLGVADTAWV